MSDWRPENWDEINPDPCKDCSNKVIDDYGYFCDLACGKHSAYLNKEAGADAMLEALRKKGFLDMGEGDSLDIHGVYNEPIKFKADCFGKLALIPEESK